MNSRRRAKLKEAKDKLSRIRDEVESICEEEDEVRANMPENLQYSERYEESEDCSRAMENAISSIDDAISFIAETI
jgi:hypothetical protein